MNGIRMWRRGALAIGVALALTACGSGGGGPPTNSVTITSPETGATVPAGEPIAMEVEVVGLTVGDAPHDHSATAADGHGHLHLFVDGTLVAMPNELEPTVTLEPGPHTLRVELVDVDHRSLEPNVVDEVDVVAES